MRLRCALAAGAGPSFVSITNNVALEGKCRAVIRMFRAVSRAASRKRNSQQPLADTGRNRYSNTSPKKRARSKSLAALATCGMALFCLSACNYFPDAKYRYKVTIAVNTPRGVMSASNVVELDYFQTAEGYPHRTYGQALVLDLETGGALVASVSFNRFRNESWYELDPTLLILNKCGMKDPSTSQMIEVIKQVSSTCRAVYPLELSDLPIVIFLKNRDDPASATVIDPQRTNGLIEPGVKIRSATIEVTDDALTTGVEDHLPWARRWSGKIEAPAVFGTGPIHRFVNHGDFIREGEG